MASKTIIVMSDSHGDRDIVQAIKDKYLGQVDAIFHNGDSELKSSDPIWDGIYVVGGNCDYDAGYPDDLVTQLDNLTIAQTHGHLYHINFTWDKLDYFAKKQRQTSAYMVTYTVQQPGKLRKRFLLTLDLFHNLVVRSMKNSMPVLT